MGILETISNEELIKECQKRGLKLIPPAEYQLYSVSARYNRGFGIEYKTFADLKAKDIISAQELAKKMVEEYFGNNLKNAILHEVKIKYKHDL